MLRSLSEQSDQDFDIVIFNDGLQNIEKLCDQFLIKPAEIKPVTGTISKIRSLGLQQLKILGYDNVIFGDADDSFARSRVEVSKNLLQVYDLVVNEIDVFNASFGGVLPRYFQKRIPVNSRFDFEAIRSFNFVGFTNSSVRSSVIPEIKFPDYLIAIDWAFFATLLQTRLKAFFTSHTTTSYYINETSHYDLASTDLLAEYYKSTVRKCHYRYLCESGLNFSKEYKKAAAWNRQLSQVESSVDPKHQYPDRRIKHPLWWEMISKF